MIVLKQLEEEQNLLYEAGFGDYYLKAKVKVVSYRTGYTSIMVEIIEVMKKGDETIVPTEKFPASLQELSFLGECA